MTLRCRPWRPGNMLWYSRVHDAVALLFYPLDISFHQNNERLQFQTNHRHDHSIAAADMFSPSQLRGLFACGR